MQYAILRKILAVLIGLGLTATGLWASPAAEEEPAAAMDKEMVMDPATGKMVTAPEYGGTLVSVMNKRPGDAWRQLGQPRPRANLGTGDGQAGPGGLGYRP